MDDSPCLDNAKENPNRWFFWRRGGCVIHNRAGADHQGVGADHHSAGADHHGAGAEHVLALQFT